MSDLFYRAFEERHRGSRELIKSRLRAYNPFIAPLITHYPAAQTLDLGCGRGEWLELLGETGYDARGIDLDEGMLAACHERGLNVRRIDALQALRELPSESVAIVSAFHLVEHIPFDDVRILVREACRVLKPGGLLILETPNPENVVVGTALFYQDPTHLNPIPPALLKFAVEFEGFPRNIIARLQESPTLHTDAQVNLLTVFEGVSPDYAVIGQKHATPELLAPFEKAFATAYGITLHNLTHRYEIQEQKRTENMVAASNARADKQNADFNYWITAANAHFSDLDAHFRDLDAHFSDLDAHFGDLQQRAGNIETRLADAERRAADLGERLLATLNSRSWRITAPMRWAGHQRILLRQHGLRTRSKAMIKKIVWPIGRAFLGYINRRPQLRQQCVNAAKTFGIYYLLQSFYGRLIERPVPKTVPAIKPTISNMNLHANKIYLDLKHAIAKNKESS